MSFVDTLTTGTAPANATTTSSSTASLPAWYSDYTRGVLSGAVDLVNAGTPMYQGPRVAPLTGDQNAAFDATRGSAFSWVPHMQGAQDVTQRAIAPGAGGMAAAQPYLQRAGQTFPGAFDQYMSPYTSQVVDRIAQLGTRNLTENMLPKIRDTFIGSGQYGSTGMADLYGRALRDSNESILGQQAQALEQGYTTAGDLFNKDASRMATLGSTAGNLAGADASRQLTGGQQLGAFAQMQQAMGLKGAAALDAIGQEQQGQDQRNYDTAYRDYEYQRELPYNQLRFLSDLARGTNTERSVSSTSTAPSSISGPSPLMLAAGIYTGLSGAQQNQRTGP